MSAQADIELGSSRLPSCFRVPGDAVEVEPAALDEVTTGDYSVAMKAVGIKQLKSRLSEYVRLARAGETILVSDRDEVVAELGPVRHQVPEPTSVEAVLDRLAGRGTLTRASQSKEGWRWKPPSLELPSGTARQILDEIREER